MPTTLRDRPPPPSHQLALPLIAAALLSLAATGLIKPEWLEPAARPLDTLPQAIAAFDAGNLAGGTAGFQKLADGGNAEAAFWYGHALDLGLGIKADPAAAIAQYRKAWAGGVTAAGTRLGELYLAGNVVPPDFTEARHFLGEAASRGDARAARDLGQMSRGGIGAPADPVAAFAWLELAALRGDAQARIERDQLLPSLTPAQQATATQQVQALQKTVALLNRSPAEPATPIRAS